jgi:predicted RNA binding protein YcfA (HicA-like mRNA interferase family)
MPRLRSLSGRDLLRILTGFGFTVVAVRGSHAKLRRELPDGRRETSTVPLHDMLATGTVRAVYRQAARFIAESDLRAHFYSES